MPASPGEALYTLRGVSRRFDLTEGKVTALGELDLEIAAGDLVALAGPSGSGKTTLLNLLGLLDTPSTGTLHFEGKDVSHLAERALTRIRRECVAFVFQTLNLIPVLTAIENVEYFLLRQGTPGKEARTRALAALDSVGLSRFAKHPASRLSGGEQQRVAIARALVREPHVILADEPTAALDHATGNAIVELMKTLNRERHVTFVFSSHDPKVLSAARRVIELEDGRLVRS